MANIKDLKKKIKSTKGTLKITQAMKLVSAAKLSRAQIAIQNSRPYANELEDMIKTISALSSGYEHDYLKKSKSEKSIVLVISSDKGLCGGYNSQLGKKVRGFASEAEEDLEFRFIGKKVRELIKREVKIGTTYTFEKTDPSFVEIQELAKEMAELFEEGEVGKVYVAYNLFESAISFVPTVKQVLPITVDESEKEMLTQKYPFDFEYDPGPEEILDTLIPESYVTSIYTSILDGAAAEHGSRMSSMDSAVTNCRDAIKTLTLKMNKLRQAAITTELIEVVSGAESLNS